MPDRYIHVRNWGRFQHPDATRAKSDSVGGLPWIRDHTAQLNDEEWLGLSFADRGLLQSLRLQYGSTRGRGMVDSTSSLTRLLGQRVLRSQLERLNHAGFIEFQASKVLATSLQPARLEKRREELPLTPQSGESNASKQEPKANPRALGTNPRAVANSDKEQAHLELVREATRIAQNWNGKDSLAFDEELDQLQADHRAQLTFVERDDLWDKAFNR